MTIFEFFVQFFFQNDILKLQEHFSEYSFRSERTWKFQDISYFTVLK
jgi:hypothetical protein